MSAFIDRHELLKSEDTHDKLLAILFTLGIISTWCELKGYVCKGMCWINLTHSKFKKIQYEG
jgi:hypothetical protein